MKSKLTLLILFIVVTYYQSISQVKPDSLVFTQYYHPNGKISSEGNLRNGKPDGYWKTYNDKRILVSEGSRKNFELDSVWTFYDSQGKKTLEITYKNGKKNGLRRSYQQEEIVNEYFINDIKQGLSKTYYISGKLKKETPFENGLENGIEREYDTTGLIISLIEYRTGFVINRERINRVDFKGQKQGVWKWFYDNGNLKLEGTFQNDKKNGFFKSYKPDGNLIVIEKYINDELQLDAPELRELEVRTDYYPNGQIKATASYNKGKPEGIRRDYNPDGTLKTGSVYKNGILVGQGIVDEKGLKQGIWKEFYDDGKLKAEGSYKDNLKVGNWKFYYKSGKLEQTGRFNAKGNYDGEWQWYYESGEIHIEENLNNGLGDGQYVEYSDTGKIIVKGEYIDGQENGFWFYELNDTRQEGTYTDGKRNGTWKHFFADRKPSFIGSYVEDNPNGKHTWYWENGNTKQTGDYVMGKREGEWRKFTEEGQLFLIVYYQDGKEIRYDNITIDDEE